MQKFRHLDLFSGIGGFALAASWVWGEQHEIVSFCEIEPFPQKVLKKHWPDVPIYDDIKTMKGDQYGRIDLVSGGFPCQPYSCAGKQKGKEDDRALWPEMFRIIQEAKPNWVIGENVAGFVNMGLDDCLSDLESEGYETTAFIIPACAVNAPHRRDRVWIIGNATSNGLYRCTESVRNINQEPKIRTILSRQGCNAANSQGRKPREQAEQERWEDISGRSWKEPWIEAATLLCGMDARVSGRVDRLKSLGNAIVPQVVVPIMQAIKIISRSQPQLF